MVDDRQIVPGIVVQVGDNVLNGICPHNHRMGESVEQRPLIKYSRIHLEWQLVMRLDRGGGHSWKHRADNDDRKQHGYR